MNWYAINTKSRHEKKIDIYLHNNNFKVFLPLLEVWSKRQDRKKRIKTPLFPGYLFVYCDMTSECRYDIIKLPGVVNILGYADGRPAPIPASQVESVQRILASEYTPRPHPYLKEGDLVVVKDGPLEGAVGYLKKIDEEKGSLIVSLDMLGRSVEVDIDLFMVEIF